MNDLDIKTMLINALTGEFVPVYLFGPLIQTHILRIFFTFGTHQATAARFREKTAV